MQELQLKRCSLQRVQVLQLAEQLDKAPVLQRLDISVQGASPLGSAKVESSHLDGLLSGLNELVL
jgi:hypothetical protein